MDSWANLTDDEIEATMNAMPGGVDGYLKEWGWLTFADAVQERLRLKNAPAAPLRAEFVAVPVCRLLAYRNHFSVNADYEKTLTKEIDALFAANPSPSQGTEQK